MRNTSSKLVGALLAFAGGAIFASTAGASEPKKATEPEMMREPTEYTDVPDAFDDDDPFDIHLSLGYQHTWRSSTIRRETSISEAPFSSGGYTASTLNVADYRETTSRLNTAAKIGLYKDIALVVRMPVILQNDRSLGSLDNSAAVQSTVLAGIPGEQLFFLPFESPTRSGIEYLAVGADFGVLNQYRDPTKPSWVIGLEGRFNVSEPMHACNANTANSCTYPNDVLRQGSGLTPLVADRTTGQLVNRAPGPNDIVLNEGESGERDPGVSRGTTGLELHTYLSKRMKYVEPYGGIEALFEFANGNSEFGSSAGSLVNHPPFEGSMVVGLTVIPWEAVDQFQRITLDLRFRGTYRSEGRDYSELFDALGSSPAASLRYPNYNEYQPFCDPATSARCASLYGNNPPSVANTDSQKVYTTGITDVQAHGRYALTGAVTWRAGEYVKFNVGGMLTAVQGHFITADQACNPSFQGDRGASGPCQAFDDTATGGQTLRITGIPNPNYRAVINTPGRRFRVDSSAEFDLFVRATLTF